MPDNILAIVSRQPDTVIVDEVYDNTRQEKLIITVDKVKVIYNDHITKIGNPDFFWALIGILFTIGSTLLTAKFDDKLISSHTWESIFIVSFTLVSCLAIKALIDYFRSETRDDFINNLKHEKD